MNEALQMLVGALVVIGGLFGASWAKAKLEKRGAEKQRRSQLLEAARVEAELEAGDVKIDAETEATILEIQTKQAARHKAEAEAAKRSPTAQEIDRFIEESKE